MNAKNRKTLIAIFQEPVRSDLNWKEIENLFKALGAEVTEGSGSRIRVALKDVRAVFHRPHPLGIHPLGKKVTDKGALKSVRRFLITVGVK
ncbi:MAG: type II toxin-antitoxin system HicA family toxin [Ignavibacteriaceae bacterium]